MADTVYQTPELFIAEALSLQKDEIPTASVIWLDKNTQTELSKILGHTYPQARLRYWISNKNGIKNQTHVWILDEIGKEYPITAGFVVENKTIQRAQVLIYRETRGAEIHLPQFLAQFRSTHLTENGLSKSVDGIAGATLSVNAMKKMAQAALLLDSKL